jgi:hypothetical protein
MPPRVVIDRPLSCQLAQVAQYCSGALRNCVPLQPVSFRYGGQQLTAQHEEEPPRRLVVAPLEFHENGTLKGVTLQSVTTLETPVGLFPAERLTFHPDGTLRRIFPTAGKPNATWTEDDEKARNPKVRLETPLGGIDARFIGLCFYPSGRLRSVTLWPGETVMIETPLGPFPGRIGLSFHENGELRCFEPARPLELSTPLGNLPVFHAQAVGIHGDTGSVEFAPDGKLIALNSDGVCIAIRDRSGAPIAVHAAREIPSLCEEQATERLPMSLSFDEERFSIDGVCYELELHRAVIEKLEPKRRYLPLLCS